MDTTAELTPVALVTGGSKGLGRALVSELAARGWSVVFDARGGAALRRVSAELGEHGTAIEGDVADPDHRAQLIRAVTRIGRLDLLVNNASELGPSPLATLDRFPQAELEHVLRVNVLAPFALLQLALPHLVSAKGIVVNVTSDAAVEPYAGWGGYGGSKAALDQLSAVLGAEQPGIGVYAFDPGDMRTEMHQAAFPGEDISDRPPAETVVPALMALLDERPPSGRYRATDLLARTVGAS